MRLRYQLLIFVFAFFAPFSFAAEPSSSGNLVVEDKTDKSYILIQTNENANNTIIIPSYDKENNKITEQKYNIELKTYDYGHTDVANRVKKYHSDYFNKDIVYSVDTSKLEHRLNFYSDDNISSINNDFVDLTFVASNTNFSGGAIRNSGAIGSIVGNFVGNHASSNKYIELGGAISNYGNIDSIEGDFIANYAYADSTYAYGGAIENGDSIGSVAGNFIGNYAYANGSHGDAYGGAIYNKSVIDSVIGDFISNYTHVNDYAGNASGGAIYNAKNANIDSIAGDFVGNYAFAKDQASIASGASIANLGRIGSIAGEFVGNYVDGVYGDLYGGAIYNNNGTIDIVEGGFIANHVDSPAGYAAGGAIYNTGNIGLIDGDFVGNYVDSTSRAASSGAINNSKDALIDTIKSNFIGNHATVASYDAFAQGGAISNSGTINSMTGDFIGNYASSNSGGVSGGAIDNNGNIHLIVGDFISNYAHTNGTYMYSNGQGGAIANSGNIDSIVSDFISNHAHTSGYEDDSYGGAIYNKEGTIGTITGDFINNYVSSNVNSSFGGAIANFGNIDNISGSFIGNYAKTNSSDSLALGGAIYTTSDLTFIADNDTNIFSGNYTQDKRGKINNAIFVDLCLPPTDRSGVVTYSTLAPTFPTLTFNTLNNGIFIIDDTIDGGYTTYTSNGKTEIIRSDQYKVSLKGDTTGAVVFNNDVINADINSQDTNIYLGRDDVFNQSQSLSLDNSSLSMVNNSVGSIVIPEFNLDTTSSMKVDVDLLNEKMDTIKAENYYVEPGKKLNVSYLNLLNDANKDLTLIQFTDNSDLASATSYTGENPVAYSPIYKYDVAYDNTNGFFSFTRGEGSSYNDFNPSVVTPSAVSLAGAYSTQMQTFNYAFQHSDNFMNIPYLERIMLENKNKYAYNGDVPINSGVFSPIFSQYDDASIWVKPYTSFENIPLKNGPEVSNISYGTLVGFDSKLKKLKNGFGRVLTGYVGYNGASQSYSGVDSTLNGGLLGGTATFYKGNFFNATTLSVGANHAKNTNMYGSDDLNMILGGVGNKTGYNFEFKNGKVILQPNLLLSYTFVNTFDYTNSAGVKMKSDPLHAIQVAPGVKLIGNFENGWQPYLGVNMVWNIIADSKVMANDVILPEMSIKPYVQYGVGVQKRFKDRFQGFLQAMVQNGGRNGVSLSAGFRWAI